MLLGLNKLSLFDSPDRYYPHNPNLSQLVHHDRWPAIGSRLPTNPRLTVIPEAMGKDDAK